MHCIIPRASDFDGGGRWGRIGGGSTYRME